ncbi:MAG: hypothetical protein NZO16_05740 [Deltaproteobacteria bacterium]|nr:hypothetical protein [Deltaproteobacteria bacterium]
MNKVALGFLCLVFSVLNLRAEDECSMSCKGAQEEFDNMTKTELIPTRQSCRIRAGNSFVKGTWFRVVTQRNFLTDIGGDNIIDDAELLHVLFNFGGSVEESGFVQIGDRQIFDDFYLSCVYLRYFGSEKVSEQKVCLPNRVESVRPGRPLRVR